MTFDKFRCKLSTPRTNVFGMLKDFSSFFKAYLKGQILLSLLLSILYCVGFGLAGLPYGYVIGFFTGFFSWIPFMGSLLGFLVAMLVILLQPTFVLSLLIKVCAVYLGIQILEGLVLAPKILGKAVGLSFWQSLGAILVGAVFFGPLGAVIAVPIAAFIKFLLDDREKRKIKKD